MLMDNRIGHKVFELETLDSKKFFCNPQSGRWVFADFMNERVLNKIAPSCRSESYEGISLVLLNVSRKCNFECTYCLIGDLKQEETVMSYEVGKKAIERVMEIQEEDRYVIFHGSEPMTNFALIKRLILYSEKQSYNIRFSMQSNGSLFNKSNLDFLIHKKVYIGISLDGMREHQNKSRPYVGGIPSYNDVIRSVRLVKENQGGIGVISVVTKDNVKYLREIASHFEKEGIDTVFFCPVSPGNKDIAPQEKELIASMLKVFDRYFHAILNGEKTIEIENVRRYLINFIPKDSPSNCSQCSIGSKYPLVGIDVNGDIYPCDYFWGNKNYLLGNIFTQSLASVVNQPNDFRTYRNVNIISGCSTCNWRRFCGGGCPGALVLKRKYIGSKSSYCAFNKTMLKYIVERIPVLHKKGLISQIVRRNPHFPLKQL